MPLASNWWRNWPKARQGESAVDPGAQAGPGHLLYAEKQRAVQPGEIPGNGVRLEGTKQPDAQLVPYGESMTNDREKL